ncbi:hypothetical protein GQ457_01G056250 [Hibiscus cannabinus]
MTIQTQEDVEAMVDTHHGNGSDICELYADFQISSSKKDSYQDFSFPPYSATPYDNFGFPSFSNPSFQHFEHASFDLNIPPYDNRQEFSGQTTFQSDPTLTLDDQGYSSPEETNPRARTGCQGCKWKVRVSKKKRKQNAWELSVYNGPHTCCAVGHRQDHLNLDSTIISLTVQPIVQASLKVTVAALMGHVRSIFHYEPEYKKTWRGKDKAIRKLHGDWDASYNDLPAWINIMQKYNLGTIADLETLPSYRNDRVVQEVRQFHRLFWTFPQCINAFKSCKPIIQVDGTFLYGRYKQVLLLAVVQDGNRKTIPIAFALEVDSDLPMSNIASAYDMLRRTTTVGTKKTLKGSLFYEWGMNFYQINLKICWRNLREKIRFTQKIMKDTTTLWGIPKEKWTNAYDEGFRYGHMTTNLAEAINSSLKGIRNLPITAIVKATYFRLGKLFATLGKESFNLRDAGHIFHPRFQKELQPMVNKSNGLYVLPMSHSDTVFRATEIPRPLQGYDPTSYRVNLEEKWCDCGYFQALKSPCQHAIAACNNCRRDYKSLVDPVYFLHSVCKVYEMEFPAIGSETEWHSNQTWPTILPDPKFVGTNLDVQILQGFITQWTCLNESVQDNQNFVVIVDVLVIR